MLTHSKGVFYRLEKKKELKQHCQTVLITYVIWARSLENFFIDKRCLTLKLEAIWHCPSKRLAGNMILLYPFNYQGISVFPSLSLL